MKQNPPLFPILCIAFIFLWLCLFYRLSCNQIASPYPAQQRHISVLPPNSECPKAPPAIHDLEFTSIYANKGDGSSRIDPASKQKYENDTKNLNTYEKQISQWIKDGLYRSKPHQITCATLWLQSWAKENALLKGTVTKQGQAVRKWALATVASHYIQIKHIKNMPKKNIEGWLNSLAEKVIDDYNTNLENSSRNNNHVYWAAWAVMAASIATNNHEHYHWAIKQYKKAINHINSDGTLSLELERKERAYHYHVFAVAPLIMMAETTKRNGYNLYKYNNGVLHRLVNLILSEKQNNQEIITETTGFPQDVESLKHPVHFAWIIPYHNRFKNDKTQELTQNLENFNNHRLGGDLNKIYNEEE